MGNQNLIYIVFLGGMYMQDGILCSYRWIKTEMDREKLRFRFCASSFV